MQVPADWCLLGCLVNCDLFRFCGIRVANAVFVPLQRRSNGYFIYSTIEGTQSTKSRSIHRLRFFHWLTLPLDNPLFKTLPLSLCYRATARNVSSVTETCVSRCPQAFPSSPGTYPSALSTSALATALSSQVGCLAFWLLAFCLECVALGTYNPLGYGN